jgi:trigger factor
MMSEVARSKAISVLLGRVKVVDTDGNPVDLSEFIVATSPADVADEETGEPVEVEDGEEPTQA